MKKTRLLSTLFIKEVTQNRRLYLLITVFFLIGILSGTVASALSDSLENVQDYVNSFLSSYSLQGAAKSQVFQLSLLNYLKFAFFLWISGWYPWLFPLCILQVLSKGFRIGFSVACFVQCFSFRGIILSFFTLFPQNIFFLPALLFFSVYQFKFLSDRRYLIAGNGNKSYRNLVYGKNALLGLIFLFFLFLCSLIEGYLIPSWLQPICSFFIAG